jgi:hypothetical protein
MISESWSPMDSEVPRIGNCNASGLYELNASLYLTRCVVSGNSMGVYNNTNSTTRAYSAGDNFIYDNATNIVGPTMTAAPLQ